jgi:tight adherence protein C
VIEPLVMALGGALCVLVAVAGLRLVRDPGPAARFASGPPAVAGERRREGPLRGLLDALGRRTQPAVLRTIDSEKRTKIRSRLDAAGRPDGMTTVEIYAARKGTWLVLLGVVGIFLCFQGQVVLGVPIAVLGWFWVDAWVWRSMKLRQAHIERDLPDFLDVLAVCVNAGVAFRPALARVAEARGGPLAEEVTVTLRQLSLGASRREAFEALRDRNRSEFLAQFVSALLQAEELGVPIADTLGELAREMRRSSHQRARQRAQRAAPQVTLVVTTFMVPAAMLIIAAALIVGTDIHVGGAF